MKLQHLEIRSFRGATRPVIIEFDPKKNITMIFGENGNGKSTISDALVCLLSENSGSLDDRSTIRDKKKYLASTECGIKDVLIKLTTDQGTFAADFSNGKEWSKTPPVGQPTVRQLRRSHITNLIDADPKDRYDELRSYIDVSKIEVAENTLRELVKETTETFKLQVRDLTSAHASLEEQWLAEGKPGNSYIEWAEDEKAKNLTDEETKKDAIRAIQTAWNNIVSAVAEVVEKNKLSGTAETELRQAIDSLNTAQMGEQKDQQSLIALLQKTEAYLSAEGQVEKCPVCTQTVEKESLVSSIKLRLSAMSEISTLMNDKDDKQRKASNAKAILDNAYSKMDNSLNTFSRCILESAIALDEKLTNAASEMNTTETLSLREGYKKHASIIKDCIIELDVQLEAIERTLKQYNLITKQYDIILNNQAKSEETELLLGKIKAVLEVAMNTRKQFVENELNSIAGEVDRIYKILHPNEALGGIKLSLKPGVNAKASLELNADFHTQKGINPQSLYSESHLDTLGICIFLALANKYNDNNTIIILDDVVMSVDHRHLDRFIELINQETTQFTHVLLTTHYQPWRNLYKHHRAGSGNIHFIELKPWSLQNGISIQSFRMDYTDLKKALENNEFDAQIIAAKAGIFLENMLDFLASKFRCKLPYFNNAKYTLGDYLTCFNNKLLNALQVHHLTKDQTTGKYVEDATLVQTPLKDIIEQLRSMAFIRNEIGAHFNLNSQVSEGEVQAFGEITLRLANLLICPDDGSLPIKERLGTFWATPNGSIRLHPLKEPS